MLRKLSRGMSFSIFMSANFPLNHLQSYTVYLDNHEVLYQSTYFTVLALLKSKCLSYDIYND